VLICKIISNNLDAIQRTAFANGIEWFGSHRQVYDKAVYVVVVKYNVAGKDVLYLQKGDSAERFNYLTCVEVKEEYFIENVKKLVEKYL
jgi:hypothetical protein